MGVQSDMPETADRFQNLIDIGIALSGERDPARLMERILLEAKRISNADGGTLYLLPDDSGPQRLEFAIIRNNSLNIALGGTSGAEITFPALPLCSPETGHENHANVATHVALSGECILIEDAYDDSRFDFSGTKKFDQSTGYRSKSFFTLPLKSYDGSVIGVLQLINSMDPVSGAVSTFDNAVIPMVEALASLAAVSIENQLLLDGQKNLLEAFIKVIARAIDAKSQHTSGHCQRVPVLTEMIARAVCDWKEGELGSFDMSDEQWYELHIAGWLHDCGKLATPNHILDKETKLQRPHDRISEIAARFTVLKRDAEIDLLKAKLAATADQHAALEQAFNEQQQSLDSDMAFLRTANMGGEFMSDDHKARVRRIAELKWVDDFGDERPLLSDEEVYNLCIDRGTLTPEERRRINDHIVVTIDMLEQLPFPKNLRNVPEYAGGHHERMDGNGYPKGLTKEQMSVPARVMAVADIFEALTARDRPYKVPMKLTVAFGIMQKMCRGNHIDADIWEIFLKSGAWKLYAQQHCLPHQMDVEDVSPYLVPELTSTD